MTERRGHAYDPEVVDAALGNDLAGLCPSEMDQWSAVLEAEPTPRTVLAGADLQRAFTALGDFADLKFPERSGRARRVARIAAAAGEAAALDAGDLELLTHAALVHDVGMVAVPTDVARMRPTPGTPAWEQMRLHPHWSARVLSRCAGLEAVAQEAARHHERLDGSGYPAALTGHPGRVASLLGCVVAVDELGPGVRELADRGGLDRGDLDHVLHVAGLAGPPTAEAHPAGLTDREVEVLAELARGGTNRDIAAALGISAKTVGTHIEHIYLKTAVRSRAAATLFAAQRGLIG